MLLLSIWIAAWVQTESWLQGLYFVGGVVATGLLLMLVAVGILRLVQYLPKDAGGLHLRHGLARLGRPGAGTMAAIISLGLGVTFVFAIWTVQDHLGDLLARRPDQSGGHLPAHSRGGGGSLRPGPVAGPDGLGAAARPDPAQEEGPDEDPREALVRRDEDEGWGRNWPAIKPT